MNTALDLLTSAGSGAIGGAIFSYALTRKLAQRDEAGRRTYRARAAILEATATLREKVRQIRAGEAAHAELTGPLVDEFVRCLLAEQPYLHLRHRRRVRRLAVTLAGKEAVAEAEKVAFVQAQEPRNAKQRAADQFAEVIRSAGRGLGQLGVLRATPGDDDRYRDVIATLDELIELVRPSGPRFGLR